MTIMLTAFRFMTLVRAYRTGLFVVHRGINGDFNHLIAMCFSPFRPGALTRNLFTLDVLSY